ncbi:MAG: hypothetical protein L3J18_10250 [Candidatus Brocadia sp.]|nr:MAG: hypothetical protein L3J18_10250 [Candidatus Brocadia sp.]
MIVYFSLLQSNTMGSLTTGKPYGLKGCFGTLSKVSGDDWGLEAIRLLPTSCHNPGCMVCSNRGAVFIKGDITNVMEAVFNTPMSPVQAEYAGRVCLLLRKAGNAIDRFFGCFLGFEVGKFSVDTKDLSNQGECKVMV